MIERAPFGSTGHYSSRVIFGAAALSRMSPERTDQLLSTLLPAGINHIDTAASYGESELRLAPWLADHRHEVFLATKTGDRAGPTARASLERSLERLPVRCRVLALAGHAPVEDLPHVLGPVGEADASGPESVSRLVAGAATA